MGAPQTGPTAKKLPGDRLGHRSKAENAKTTVVDAAEELPFIDVPLGLEPNPAWHSTALAAWNALLASPVRKFYEASDLVHIWATCELLHQCVTRGMTAGQAQQLRMYLNDVMATETARRAADVSIKKAEPTKSPEQQAAVLRMVQRRDDSRQN